MESIFTTIIITISSGLIGGFISYYFSEKNANYEFDLLKKEQAARIAELFALWIRYNDDDILQLPTDEKLNYYEKLNRLTWELAIWLNDEKVLSILMKKLSAESKVDIKEIVFQAREIIRGKKCKEIKWQDIVSFTPRKK